MGGLRISCGPGSVTGIGCVWDGPDPVWDGSGPVWDGLTDDLSGHDSELAEDPSGPDSESVEEALG
jgi:hypothetical protein